MSKFLPFNLFIRQALLYPLVAPFLPAINNVKKGIKYAAGKLTGTYVPPLQTGLPKTGQDSYYEEGDDGDLQKGYPLYGDRFVDQEDGTILDRATGLEWVRDPSVLGGYFGSEGSPETMMWATAVSECYNLSYAGHDDWRLPNVFELVTLLNFGGYGAPYIDNSYFYNIQSAGYWTSSTYPPDSYYASIVSFENLYMDIDGKEGYRYTMVCRGPVNIPE